MSASASALGPQLLTVGRVNLDLYVEQLGVAMADAARFRASVGGSPTNIAIVASRLGLPSALLSAVGADFTGQLVRRRLAATGVGADWLLTRPGATSLALLATLSADIGERQFYRDDPADSHVDVGVVAGLPWASLRAVAVSADALARGEMAATAAAVAGQARTRGVPVWWDLDLRPTTWADLGDYTRTVRAAATDASVIIGTEDEFAALFGLDPDDVAGIEKAIARAAFPEVVLKRGARGAALFVDGHEAASAPAVSADPVCTVGGGDATAGSLLAARLTGLDWQRALWLAMRVAGRTVERPYCSDGFPTLAELGLHALTDLVDEVRS